MSPPCPACGLSLTTDLGRLRQHETFVHLEQPGNIYKCKVCGLFFRHPYLSHSDLMLVYGGLPADRWINNEGRTDFALVANAIQCLLSSGCVLDVGCYCGDFLMTLPESYRKFGVETAEAARCIAERRDIQIIGPSIEQIENSETMFNVITLIDVIEHLSEPMKSLQRLVKLVQPGGFIMLTTGNTDALPWRLMRNDYWYYFSEHVSFFNPRWFRWASERLGLDVISVKKFSHFKSMSSERWRQFAKCLVFLVVEHSRNYPALKELICRAYPFNRTKGWIAPPDTNLWKDHILVVMKLACRGL